MNFTITHITKDKVFAKEVNNLSKPIFNETGWHHNIPCGKAIHERELSLWQEAENNLKEYEVVLPTYCQRYEEEESICKIECDHCKEYYLPIKLDKFTIGQTISGTLITEDGKQKIQL